MPPSPPHRVTILHMHTTHSNAPYKMNLSTVKWAQWDKTQSRELLGLFICVCIALCTIVAHSIAQNRPDNFPSYPPDNHHCSDDVYLREAECRRDRRIANLTWKSIAVQSFFDQWPVQTGNMSQKLSTQAIEAINWHAKHHLKFTNISRIQFANQSHGESKHWSSADPRSLRVYDDSASPVRCNVKLT